MKTAGIVLVVGVLAIGAYIVVTSTSGSTSSYCSGDWTDYFNPLCWGGNLLSGVTSEINTILIIVAAVIIIVVGLLAFGPSSGAVAGHAAKAFI